MNKKNNVVLYIINHRGYKISKFDLNCILLKVAESATLHIKKGLPRAALLIKF